MYIYIYINLQYIHLNLAQSITDLQSHENAVVFIPHIIHIWLSQKAGYK